MGVLRRVLAAWVVVAVVPVGVPSSYGTTHYHKTTTRRHKEVDESYSASSIAMPPADSPAGPTVPSDPYPSGPPFIFDVRSYGAVGDGSTDDRAAFQAAWKAACAVEDGVLLIPSDSSFMIRSTIFSGPCQPGFMFQVDGVLMPPDGPDCWPEFDNIMPEFYSLRSRGLRRLAMIGGGLDAAEGSPGSSSSSSLPMEFTH